MAFMRPGVRPPSAPPRKINKSGGFSVSRFIYCLGHMPQITFLASWIEPDLKTRQIVQHLNSGSSQATLATLPNPAGQTFFPGANFNPPCCETDSLVPYDLVHRFINTAAYETCYQIPPDLPLRKGGEDFPLYQRGVGGIFA